MPTAPATSAPINFNALQNVSSRPPVPAPVAPAPTAAGSNYQLDDSSRSKLDGIVQQMQANKEPDENIQAVVNDFKQKYGSSTPAPTSTPVADFARSVYSGVATPVLNMLARPGQAAVHLAGNEEPQSGDLPIGFGATAHINDPMQDTDTGGKSPTDAVTSDLGKAAQTIALGLGPVAGGAAFSGGAALDQNKPILPTGHGDNIVDKVTNLATDNVLGNAVTGAGLGKVGEAATGAIGKTIKSVGTGLKTFGSGADAIYGSAQKNIENVLAPTTKANKLATERLAPQAARVGLPISATRSSLLSKLNEGADTANAAITKAWSDLPAGSKVDVNPIINAISKQMGDLKVATPEGHIVPSEQQALYNQLETKASELLKLSDGKGYADAAALRSYRQSLDNAVAQNKSASFAFSPTDTAKLAGTKLVANASRGEIAKQLPGVGPANKAFNFNHGLADILDATITRKTGQGTPLGEKIMEGAGAASGFATHGVTGGIEYAVIAKIASKVLQSTAWQTASAAAKKQLADAIAAHDGGAIATAIKSGFKLTGTGLEHVGNFISGIPAASKSLPRTAIPGTTLGKSQLSTTLPRATLR